MCQSPARLLGRRPSSGGRGCRAFRWDAASSTCVVRQMGRVFARRVAVTNRCADTAVRLSSARLYELRGLRRVFGWILVCLSRSSIESRSLQSGLLPPLAISDRPKAAARSYFAAAARSLNHGLDEGRRLVQLSCNSSQKGVARARTTQELGQQSRTSGARATQEL